jgi:predicted dithiol-disulfide oxidoreductase (DUF899 family)
MRGRSLPKKHPAIVSQQEWQAAREKLLMKEKAVMRSHDALAAERRRMPWMAVEKRYEFEGSQGKVSFLDLFESRRQLIVYRAFFEPGVAGWPEHDLINSRGDEATGTVWNYLDMTALGRQETWEDSPAGYPQTPPYKWWKWHDS